VRQPLGSITGPELAEEMKMIVLSEVNIKKYKTIDANSSTNLVVLIDETITPELKAEGAVREFMRAVQEGRKAAGFAPHDRITLTISTNVAGQNLITKFTADIKKVVGADKIIFTENDGIKISAGEYTFVVLLTRN